MLRAHRAQHVSDVPGERFLVAGRFHTLREILDATMDAAGKHLVFSLPPWLALGMGHVSEHGRGSREARRWCCSRRFGPPRQGPSASSARRSVRSRTLSTTSWPGTERTPGAFTARTRDAQASPCSVALPSPVDEERPAVPHQREQAGGNTIDVQLEVAHEASDERVVVAPAEVRSIDETEVQSLPPEWR